MSVILKLLNKELDFIVGRDETATSSFKLENISKELVAFKVKTTAPRRYTVRPNSGLIGPGETTQVKVSLNLSKEPKRDADPDKFQILSILVNVSVDNKPPRPDDANYADYLRRLWKAASPDKFFKERLKINIKRDPLRNGSNRIANTGMNASFRTEKRTEREDTTTRENKSVPTLRDGSRPPTERKRESSRAPSDRGRESSRPPIDRERTTSRTRDRSRSVTSDREARTSRSVSRSRRESSRSGRRGESVGPPRDRTRDRERSRSRTYDDYRDRERSRTRERSASISRSRDYDRREDRGRDYYDRSRSRGRRSDDDDGYLSSRDISRSRSPSNSRLRDSMMRDDRSRSRSSSRDLYRDYSPYDRLSMNMDRRQRLDERERPLTNSRELDSILRRYEVLNVKTAQKTQERQLIFVALAFFIGFIFAQGILY